jgi:hypothetical protein
VGTCPLPPPDEADPEGDELPDGAEEDALLVAPVLAAWEVTLVVADTARRIVEI